jgi:hypothetical protein
LFCPANAPNPPVPPPKAPKPPVDGGFTGAGDDDDAKGDLNVPSEDGAPNAGAVVGVGVGVVMVVEAKEDCVAAGVENADTDTDMDVGDDDVSLVWGLGLKKGEEVGVTSLPKAPNPDAGLNAEGVVVRLPNAPPPKLLEPKGEADGMDGILVSGPGPGLVTVPKGEVSGEDEGEAGRVSGFVGVLGVSSSLAWGELSLNEEEGIGWGWV